MNPRGPEKHEIDRFIREHIDTVPHLEALLLLWESRPRKWAEVEMSERLFVPAEAVRRIGRDLALAGLVAVEAGVYEYLSSSAMDEMMEAVDAAYRTELVRITNLIHSKAPGSVREFARAFEFGRRD